MLNDVCVVLAIGLASVQTQKTSDCILHGDLNG